MDYSPQTDAVINQVECWILPEACIFAGSQLPNWQQFWQQQNQQQHAVGPPIVLVRSTKEMCGPGASHQTTSLTYTNEQRGTYDQAQHTAL